MPRRHKFAEFEARQPPASSQMKESTRRTPREMPNRAGDHWRAMAERNSSEKNFVIFPARHIVVALH